MTHVAPPTPAADAAPPVPVEASPGGWPDRLIGVMPFVAVIGVVAIAAGVALLAIPVNNPKVQECGSPAMYLWRGRVDVYADPAHPPGGLTKAQANHANVDRCGHRAAERAIPGALLVVLGGVLGLLAALTEWISRTARRRRRLGARAP